MPKIISLQLVRFDPRSFHKKRKGALVFLWVPPWRSVQALGGCLLRGTKGLP